MGEVLGDLPQRGEHANASVLELRRAVPLHLLGGAVLPEAEGVEGPAGLDVEAHESLQRVGRNGARRGLALLRRHLEAVFPFYSGSSGQRKGKRGGAVVVPVPTPAAGERAGGVKGKGVDRFGAAQRGQKKRGV